MLLNILSNLHMSQGSLKLPENDADLVVLAGDIARPREAVSWAVGFGKPVFYVPGNHEFYGGSIARTVKELKQLCAGTSIHVLDNDELVIEGIRFLGNHTVDGIQPFWRRRKAARGDGRSSGLHARLQPDS